MELKRHHYIYICSKSEWLCAFKDQLDHQDQHAGCWMLVGQLQLQLQICPGVSLPFIQIMATTEHHTAQRTQTRKNPQIDKPWQSKFTSQILSTKMLACGSSNTSDFWAD